MGNEILITGFLLGLFGSAHCAGMCGPIALALPGAQKRGISLVTGRLLYNFGRVVTYMLMGAILGVFGAGISLAGYQQVLSIITGVFILGFALLPRTYFNKWMHASPAIFQSTFGQSFARLMKNGSHTSLAGIGLLNGLLPCGFVYMGLIGALAMGSVTGSMTYMLLFGLGTIPVMLGMSLAPSLLNETLKAKMRRALPYVAIAIGLLLILRGLSLGIPFVSPILGGDMHTVAESCH
jgi:sulfite exporter TauE/SafE